MTKETRDALVEKVARELATLSDFDQDEDWTFFSVKARAVIPLIERDLLREILAASAEEYPDRRPSLDLLRLLRLVAERKGIEGALWEPTHGA